MIDSLTPKQESEIPGFVEKYVRIGLCTDRINPTKARRYAKKLFGFLEKKVEPTVILADGPLDGWRLVVACDKNPGKTETQIRRIAKTPKNISLAKKTPFVWPYLDGSFSSNYIAWVKFMEHLRVEITIDYSIIEDQLEFGLIFPIGEYCVITDRPTEIHTKDNRFHLDGGPSVRYADGFRLWILNGVYVTREIAETPADELDPAIFKTLQSDESRREFVKKVGLARMCEKFGNLFADSYI